MRAAFVICVLLALSCSVLAQAQKLDLEQPLQELMVSETVYPQEKHEVQLTLGTRIENEIGVVKSVSPLGLEYGITDSWQVGIEWDAYQWRGSLPSQRGTGDVEAETKFSFLNIRGSRNHAAVSFRLALPTGDAEQGLGEGTVEFQPSIILARDLGKRVQVFTQFGFGVSHRVAASADADRKVIWNFGTFVPYKQVRFTLESTTQSTAANGMKLQLTPGIVVQARNYEIGLGFSQPLGIQECHSQIVVKVTREFGGRSRNDVR